jgi:hypothetical protein
MAEQVEFELSVLLGEWKANSNSQYSLANRKRIGTAKLGNRDKRDPLPSIGPELAVSGSDSAVPVSQDPAKAREFSGWSRLAGAKSLQSQTCWRREWDSNPRYPSGYTRSPGACLKPLGHLSARSPTLAGPRSRAAGARPDELAEREGFEPSMGFTPYSLSRGAPSATRPPLRRGGR